MAENVQIESPSFEKIRRGDPKAIEEAIRAIWLLLTKIMNEQKVRAGRG